MACEAARSERQADGQPLLVADQCSGGAELSLLTNPRGQGFWWELNTAPKEVNVAHSMT